MISSQQELFYWPLVQQRVALEDLVEMDMKKRITILNKAIMREDMEDIETLIASGVDPNARGKGGRTCIMSAVYKHRPQILPLLLAMDGIDLNVRDKRGFSALHLAASTNNFDAIQMIVNSYHNFDINIQDNTGQTPLHLAIQKAELQLVQLLLSAKAQVNITDKNGVSPLLMSSRTAHVDVFSAILDSGGDVNLADTRGRTPAIWCCRNGFVKKLTKLLQYDVDLTVEDRVDHMSAFSQAVWKDNADCALAILKHPSCPSLLRSQTPELATGKVYSYWEVARSRKNSRLQAILFQVMMKQIFAVLIEMKGEINLSEDLLNLIATYAV